MDRMEVLPNEFLPLMKYGTSKMRAVLRLLKPRGDCFSLY